MALRLMIYDRSCPRPWFLPGLSQVWGLGRHLYRALGRLDASRGAASWAEALDWLATVQPEAPIAEIQFWGHGRWGLARIGERGARRQRAAAPGTPTTPGWRACAIGCCPDGDALWWFRTCETFGTETRAGLRPRLDTLFRLPRRRPHLRDRRLAERAAFAAPGASARLVGRRGRGAGRLAEPDSGPGAPNTITFLHGRIPEGF